MSETAAVETETESDFVWRITRKNDGGVSVEVGTKLSDAGITDDTKLQLIGNALIKLGTRLLTSTVDDDDWDDEEDDEEG